MSGIRGLARRFAVVGCSSGPDRVTAVGEHGHLSLSAEIPDLVKRLAAR